MAAAEQRRPEAREVRIQDAVEVMRFQANIKARHIIVHRPSPDSGGGAFNMQMAKKQTYLGQGLHLGSSPDLSNIEFGDAKDGRVGEKKELQGLNARLASYIEKSRHYEAMSRKLNDDLNKLKALWGNETLQVKARYQAELDEARRLLDDANTEKSALNITLIEETEKNEELQLNLKEALREAAEAKEKLEQKNQLQSDLEAEVGLLRRRQVSVEAEKEKEMARNKKLKHDLNETRKVLKIETIKHIEAETRRQTLEEELTLLKTVHEQQLREFQALINMDSMAKNQEFWKSEMGKALRDIQELHNERLEDMRLELEMYYNQRVEMIRDGEVKNNVQWTYLKDENDKLRDQLRVLGDKFTDADNKYLKVMRQFDLLAMDKGKREGELESWNDQLQKEVVTLQAKLEALFKQLKIIAESNRGLELELTTYRRLLEIEENRAEFRHPLSAIESGSSQEEYRIRETETTSGDHSMRVSQSVKGEMAAKVQKSAKGPVAISDCAQDGKYVVVENTGRKDEVLGRWSLTRIIDSVEYVTYTFDECFVIHPGATIKVWSRGAKPYTGTLGDLESSLNWGTGKHVITKLINPVGEERAIYTLEISGGNIVHVVNNANS